MRKLSTALLLFILLFASCKKDLSTVSQVPDTIMNGVSSYLKQNLSPEDFKALDFSRFDNTALGDGSLNLVRISFVGKSMSSDFVLVQTDGIGNGMGGRIVHIDQFEMNIFSFNGSVSINSLHHENIVSSEIKNGYITAFHVTGSGRVSVNSTVAVDVVPASAGASVLPELVVVGYVNSTGTPPTLAAYMNLLALMASSPNGSAAGSTGGIGPVGSGNGSVPPSSGNLNAGNLNTLTPLSPNGGGTTTTGNLSVSLLKPLDIESDYSAGLPLINLQSLLNCFNNVPSAGATYSVKLCADLPVNSNPNYVTLGGTAGHTFLVLTKTNGTQSVSQSYGFYPATALSILSPFGSVKGGVKDNGDQEINASITMSLTAAQFALVESNSLRWAGNDYSLISYNCTSFALSVFNSVRVQPVSVDPLIIYLPANTSIYNPNTAAETISIPQSPEALFLKLQQMKTAGSSEAGNIAVDQTHNTNSPQSHGFCN